MAKRRNIPLFELLGNGTQSPPNQPARSTPRQTSRPPATREPYQVQLSALTLSIAGVSVLILLVLSWTLAYRVGYRDAESELLTTPVEQSEPAPREPSQGTSPPTMNRVQAPGDPTGAPIESRPSRSSSGPTSAQAVLTPAGSGLDDPRVVGSNYLELVILGREQAQAAIDFLWSRSEPAIAVPVLEAGRSRANTSPRYRVIATGLAVPGGRFTASRAERERFERTIASIGRAWLKDHSGASDFSSPLWKRYDP